MKKGVSILFVMMGLLSVSYAGFAQSPPVQERNLIFTEGVAEVMGRNDSARISIAVVTDGKDLEQISAENARKTEKILKVIKRLTGTGLKVETSSYRVTPQKDYKARPPVIKGYEVYNAIEVTLESMEPEPVNPNAMNFDVATTTLPPSAANTAFFESPDIGAVLVRERLTP